MAQPTIEDILGTGAQRLASGDTTTSSGLFIPDSALIAAGLDDPTNATAQQHFVAILVKASGVLTSSAFDADTDRTIYFEPGLSNFINRGANNERYENTPLTINMAKLNPAGVLDPDSY